MQRRRKAENCEKMKGAASSTAPSSSESTHKESICMTKENLSLLSNRNETEEEDVMDRVVREVKLRRMSIY